MRIHSTTYRHEQSIRGVRLFLLTVVDRVLERERARARPEKTANFAFSALSFPRTMRFRFHILPKYVSKASMVTGSHVAIKIPKLLPSTVIPPSSGSKTKKFVLNIVCHLNLVLVSPETTLGAGDGAREMELWLGSTQTTCHARDNWRKFQISRSLTSIAPACYHFPRLCESCVKRSFRGQP